MKKSLVALAVLATTGAALAQSNVTLYGRIDTSIGSNKLNGVSTTQLFSGNLSLHPLGCARQRRPGRWPQGHLWPGARL